MFYLPSLTSSIAIHVNPVILGVRFSRQGKLYIKGGVGIAAAVCGSRGRLGHLLGLFFNCCQQFGLDAISFLHVRSLGGRIVHLLPFVNDGWHFVVVVALS